MFCSNCKVEYIEENQEKCFSCGAALNVEEKTETETETETVAEAEAEVIEEPVEIKRGLNKKTLLIIVAAVAVVLILSGVSVFAFFKTPIKMAFMPIKDVYMSIEADNISSSVNSLVNIKADAAKSVKTSNEISVDNISGEAIPIETQDLLKTLKVVLNTEIDQKSIIGNADASVLSGTTELFKANVSASQDKAGINFPAMDTNYYSTDFSKIREYLLNSLDTSANPTKNFCKMSGITEQQLTDILVSYGKELLITNIDKAKIEYNSSSVEIENAKYNNISVSYDGPTIKKILVGISNKVKSDTVLKKAIYTYYANTQSQSAKLLSAYTGELSTTINEADFNKSIDQAMDSMASIPDAALSDVLLTNTIYFDAGEKIVARGLDVAFLGVKVKSLFVNMTTNGSNKQSLYITTAAMTLMELKNTMTGSKTEGSLKVNIPSVIVADMTYSFDKKDANGAPVLVGNLAASATFPGVQTFDPATFVPISNQQNITLKVDSSEITPGSEYLTKITGSFVVGDQTSDVSVSLKSKYSPISSNLIPTIASATTPDMATINQKKFQKDIEEKVLIKLKPLQKIFSGLS